MWLHIVLSALSIQLAVAVQFNIQDFRGQLTPNSGLLRSLKPSVDTEFDFSPSDVFGQRNNDGNYHTGDLNLRYRSVGSSHWHSIETASNRNTSLKRLPVSKPGILKSDLTSLAPKSGTNITRTWTTHAGDLVLSFNVSNVAQHPIEIGGFGIPLEFNNIFTNRSPAAARSTCSLIDPYIGLHAGYVQVTRLNGLGPNLVITPFTKGTKLEAWEFLQEPSVEPLYYQSTSYEGNYEWLVHSKAYAETNWTGVEPWNTPSSTTLQPGQSVVYGVRFTVVPEVWDIETKVRDLGFPVAVGFPGYILNNDMDASLYLNSDARPTSVKVSPVGSLKFSQISNIPNQKWLGYSVIPTKSAFGRVKVELSYSNAMTQTIHYWLADKSQTTVDKVGQHASTKQWYTNTSDPFHRAPSIISFDKTSNSVLLQDSRTYIAGLSDEGGTGSFVTFAMKQIIHPDKTQVKQLEQFANKVVWGHLQHKQNDKRKYSVRKSLFYYQPNKVPGYDYSSSIDWSGSWDKSEAYLIDRAYDYVWVSVVYWVLYKVNRISPGITTMRSPDWYLKQAYHTVSFCFKNYLDGGKAPVDYIDDGLMGETLWGLLLDDLQAEGYHKEASHIQNVMRKRQNFWASEADPYGSEQPWDCTGQEGVYYWSEYFNDTTTARKTIQSIHAFDPAIPHWGYNGNARRYWDFVFAGSPQLSRIERQIHHYGSSLNALPLLDWYRRSSKPGTKESLYDLRVGYGGHMGSISNIAQDGYFSMAFHSFANTLAWDNYTADYGPNFLGHVLGSASYLVKHPDFGWLSFGGNVDVKNQMVTVVPKDVLRRRLFIAPLGLWVEFESGMVENFVLNENERRVDISIGSATSNSTLMTFDQTSNVLRSGSVTLVTKGLKKDRGGYIVTVPGMGKAKISFEYRG